MRLAAALGAALLLIAAPASAELSAVSPAQKVTSRDGGLTVSVPRGALKKNVKVRIRILTRAQYPPELRNATFRPGSKLYALEPAGLTFLKPVTVTRRIDAKVAGFDIQGGSPLISLAVTDGKRRWETLGRQTLRVVGDTIVLTGTTRHFSTAVAFDEAVRAQIEPPSVDKLVGDRWTASVVAKIDNTRRRDPIERSDEAPRWSSTGAVGQRLTYQPDFLCRERGSGSYSVFVTYEYRTIVDQIVVFKTTGPIQQTVYLSAPATCRAVPPTPLQLAAACVVVAHTPFGPYPSFTRWLLRVAGQLTAGAQASLTAEGVSGGQPVGGTMNLATGAIEFTGGISSYGQKPVQNLTVAGQNLTQQLVSKVGTPNVTAAQGTIAGQCPP